VEIAGVSRAAELVPVKNQAMDVVIEGNFPAEEIWNSGLHGLGVLFAIWGLWELLQTEFLTYPVRLGITVYGLSAILLFTASTLYHSFFSFTLTKRIFQIADHCSVFVLIAGSYTPICVHLAVVRDIPTAWTVLKAEWFMCIAGILLHTLSLHWPKWSRSLEYMMVELCIYVAMGWLVVVMWEPVAMFLDPTARYLLMMGGILYMMGVGFFVWDSIKIVPALHVVWHFFVLAAAVTQFFSIRTIVTSSH
jgi:hemolysin III